MGNYLRHTHGGLSDVFFIGAAFAKSHWPSSKHEWVFTSAKEEPNYEIFVPSKEVWVINSDTQVPDYWIFVLYAKDSLNKRHSPSSKT